MQFSHSRINPVEKIYASFPFFLFINATYAGQLLSPLLEFQDTPSNGPEYAARDLGNRPLISHGCCTSHDIIGQNYPQVDSQGLYHEQQVERM